MLAHANRVADPAALGIWEPLETTTSTPRRGRRMQALLEAHRGRLDAATLAAILRRPIVSLLVWGMARLPGAPDADSHTSVDAIDRSGRARNSPCTSTVVDAIGLRLVMEDAAAVRAALVLPHNQGQFEGQVTRLKLLKRAMDGRAKVDLLRPRVRHAAAQ